VVYSPDSSAVRGERVESRTASRIPGIALRPRGGRGLRANDEAHVTVLTVMSTRIPQALLRRSRNVTGPGMENRHSGQVQRDPESRKHWIPAGVYPMKIGTGMPTVAACSVADWAVSLASTRYHGPVDCQEESRREAESLDTALPPCSVPLTRDAVPGFGLSCRYRPLPDAGAVPGASSCPGPPSRGAAPPIAADNAWWPIRRPAARRVARDATFREQPERRPSPLPQAARRAPRWRCTSLTPTVESSTGTMLQSEFQGTPALR